MIPVHLSKYAKLLSTFDEEDLKSYGLWLKSPWCNTNKNLITLFDKIKRYHPNYKDRKLTKERLSKMVLPKGKFSEKRINNLLSVAFLDAERFLVFQNLDRKKHLKKELLIDEFEKRHLEEWFFKSINPEIKRLEEKEIMDWEDHLDLFRLNRRVYHFPSLRQRYKVGAKAITGMGQELELAYLLEKAALISEKISRTKLLKDENYDVSSDLVYWRSGIKGIEHPAIELYKIHFDYLETDDIDKYHQLKDLTLKLFVHLNEKEKKIHLGALINTTIVLIRKGNFDITYLLPFYKLGLNSGIFLEKGILSYKTFASLVSASNSIRDFDFSNELISIYSNKLELKVRSDGVVWAKAHTAYYKKDLNGCLDILVPYEFKLPYFQLIARVLTTQTYFDLYLENDTYQDFLFNYFNTFEKWIFRGKNQSETIKKSYARFIQICRKLAKYYIDVEPDLEKIKLILKNEKNIQGSKWLGERVDLIMSLKKKGSFR